MKSIDFVRENIDLLVTKHPKIKCTYEFNNFSQSHYVEILPKEYNLQNDKFMNDEMEILIRFIEQFPYETLTFITDDDLYSIEDSNYIKIGSEYVDQIIEFSLKNLAIEKSLLTKGLFNIENNSVNYIIDHSSYKLAVSKTNSDSNQEPFFEAGENNYTMAA